MYAFCTRPTLEGRSGSADLALRKEADGGIRTLDPRFTRVIWGRERRMPEGAGGLEGLQFARFGVPALDTWNP
jgi:hypothetical protein